LILLLPRFIPEYGHLLTGKEFSIHISREQQYKHGTTRLYCCNVHPLYHPLYQSIKASKSSLNISEVFILLFSWSPSSQQQTKKLFLWLPTNACLGKDWSGLLLQSRDNDLLEIFIYPSDL